MNDSRNSLPPEIYHKEISLSKQPRRAILYASAMGIYEAEINDRKIGNHYFTPGYTHYQTYLQFQSYDVTEFIKQGKNEIDITVRRLLDILQKTLFQTAVGQAGVPMREWIIRRR